MFTPAPAELILKLEELIPEFAQEKYKESIATMLWMSMDLKHQHRVYKSSITLTTEEVKKLFGRVSNFKDLNRMDHGRYFTVHRFSNYTGDPEQDYTNGYEPRPWLKAILNEYLEQHVGVEFRDGRGRKVKPLTTFSGFDARGNRTTRWNGVQVTNLIPVKLENLQIMEKRFARMLDALREHQLPKKYESSYGSTVEQYLNLNKQIKTLIRQATHFGGSPIQYVQSNTGRLYAHGINLQSCKTQIKQAALAGCHEYDIEACHLTIMNQMAERHGVLCPSISFYTAHKTNIRTELAQTLAADKNAIKRALNAMAYGAKESLHESDSIPQILGIEKASKLYSTDFYRSLKSDISKAVKVILKKHLLSKKRFINAVGKELIVMKGKNKLELSKIRPHTKMAHLIQGVEAQVLEITARAFPNQILLLQHDGFATKERIDTGKLVQTIEAQTGFRLTFNEEKIEFPDPEFDDDFVSINTKLEYPKKVNINNGLDVFWESLWTTVGVGRGDLLPAFPIPLPEGGFDF